MPKVEGYHYDPRAIVKAMRARNVNPKKVGRALGISAGTVRAWLRGDNAPRLDTYLEFCKEYGYNPTTLLARDGKR